MERKWHFDGAEERTAVLLYGGVALGLVAGAAISTYVWRQRVKASLNLTPLQRAEKLIEACEKKLETIEESVRSLQEKDTAKQGSR